MPVVRLTRTPLPSAVLLPATTLPRAVASDFGVSPKQTSASGMSRKAPRKGGRFIEFLTTRVAFFDLNRFIVVVLFSRLLTLRLLGLKEGRKYRERAFLTLPRIQIFGNGGEFGTNYASSSRQFAASANRRFKFEK